MEKLFTPDVGLMAWTILTFLILVGVLSRVAWRPILDAMRAREDSIKKNIQTAEAARSEAENLRREFEAQMATLDAKGRDLLARAQAESLKAREDMLRQAQLENEKLLDATRKKLAEEERRLSVKLREDMADLSLRATEKFLRKGLDKATQDRLLKETLEDLEKAGSGKA